MSDKNDGLRFEDILRDQRGRLAAVAFAYAPKDPEDLLQEILLQIWRSLPSFQGRASPATWCYRIALNTAISWGRSARRRRQQLATQEADLGQISGTVDGYDSTQLLQQFLRSLSATDRAIVLMYLDDLSGAEMAEITGLTHAAVRVRIHRIKRQLADWTAGDE